MEKISFREILIGIVVLLLSITTSIFLEPLVFQKQNEDIRKFQEAVKIDNNSELFLYSKKTQAGNILAYGKIEAYDPVTFSELNGMFSVVTRYYQEYRMHTRTYETCSGSGKTRSCTTRTETYWTWDTIDHETKHCKKWKFLGEVFDNIFDINNSYILALNKETVSANQQNMLDGNYLCINKGFLGGCSNKRYYFEISPTSFNITAFFRFYNNVITNPINESGIINTWVDQKINAVVDQQPKNLQTSITVYYIVVFILSLIIYGMLAYYVLPF